MGEGLQPGGPAQNGVKREKEPHVFKDDPFASLQASN